MKILEVVYGLASGGAERLVVDLSNELAETNDVTLLVLKDVEHFYAPQISNRVNIIYANFKVGKNPKYLFSIIPIIKKINPDIIHYHSQARYTLILANILLRNRYKFFMTIHSDVALNYSKGVSGLQVRICGLLGKCRFITISETNEKQFKLIHPKLLQRMIINGRALPKISKDINNVKHEISNYKTSNDSIVFIHVARFDQCKNQELLIDAFNKINEDGVDFILLIIGAGFHDDRSMALRTKACNKIHFLGAKDNIYDYLSCADVFCLSSLYEGMPMTIIEALLSGLPIISTPVSGAIDAVTNRNNGIISEGFGCQEYANAIRLYIENKESINNAASKGIKDSPYTISNCAQKHIEWFKS